MIKDYKLYLGDNVEVMRKEIKDESIDFILTSPPYDDLRTYNDTCVWNFEIFKNVANELYRVLKEGVPRIELFARDLCEGWDSVGNEIDGKDIRDVIGIRRNIEK